jgi:two-component sensor histidine kinase
MGMYLTTLLDQVTHSLQTIKPVKTIVDAHGVLLDIPRATPSGLIVNELVTNSFKYAFPDSFDSQVIRNAPPTITVTFAQNGGEYVLTVSDNGIGLPPGFDIRTSRTLGLKLVNFLGTHQLMAKIEVNTEKGTKFIFRFNA